MQPFREARKFTPPDILTRLDFDAQRIRTGQDLLDYLQKGFHSPGGAALIRAAIEALRENPRNPDQSYDSERLAFRDTVLEFRGVFRPEDELYGAMIRAMIQLVTLAGKKKYGTQRGKNRNSGYPDEYATEFLYLVDKHCRHRPRWQERREERRAVTGYYDDS